MKYYSVRYLLILFLYFCSKVDSKRTNTDGMVVKPTGANTINVTITSNKEEAEGSNYKIEYALMPGDNWVIVNQCIYPINKGNYTCTITGIKAITTYNIKLYACVQGPISKTCDEMMTVPTTTKPNESNITNINNRKSNSVTVNYAKAAGDTGSNLKYFVTYGAATIVDCPASGYACDVTELTPNTEYSFKVVVCPKDAETTDETCSQPSISVSAFTLPGIPLTGIVINMTSSSLLVSWTPPSPNGGQLADYDVRTSPHDRTCVGKSSCELTQLTSATKYTINIRACRTTDECGEPYTLNAQTKPGAPSSIDVTQRTSYSLLVTWTNLEPVSSLLDNMTVTAKPTLPDVMNERQCFVKWADHIYTCELSNLAPCTEFIVDVVACAAAEGAYPSLCSQPTEINSATLAEAPRNVTIGDVTSDSVKVRWPAATSCKVDKYRASAIPITKSDEEKSCEGSGQDNSCQIVGLQSEATYIISVQSCAMDPVTNSITCGDPVLSEHLITNKFLNIALIVGLCLFFIALIIVAILGFIYRRPIRIFVASKMLQEKPKPISPRVEDHTFGRIFYAELDPNADFTNKIPPPIPFESFKAFVAGLSKVNAFSEQYKLIDDLAVEQATTYKLTTYVPNENPNLNRYIHMESYDQSMVLLNYDWETIRKNPRPQIPLDANTDTMYINASFVRTCNYNSQGRAYVSEQSPIAQYIACQAPMTHTVADFHTMIYNYRVPLVVMLCTETQKGKPKCARYWPDGSEQEFFSQYRTIRVCKLKEDILPNFTVRILTVCPHDQTQSWKFTQIQFLKWEDHGVPDASIFCELLDKCINTRQLCPMGDVFGPTVVHCSAGVGRTGTFICANMLLDRLRVAPENIDVCGTVLAVRKYRKTMVQTPSQLQFLYDIIMHVIDKENIQIGQVPSNTTELEYENLNIVTHIDPYHDNEYANMGEGENGIA